MLRKILVKKYPYVLIPPLPMTYRLTKVHFLNMEKRTQRFINRVFKSELLKSDPDLYLFLTSPDPIANYLVERNREKLPELGLHNVFTEEGRARIQSDPNSAFLAGKFPEVLSTFKTCYDEIFAAVKDIRNCSQILAQEYQHVGEKLMQLDVLNKEWTAIEEDFNVLGVSQGMIKLSNFYQIMSESFYDNLRRNLGYTADLTRISYKDLWEGRQHYMSRFLKLQEQLIDKKLKLFQKPQNIESQWGIKDKLFLA